MQKPFWIVEFSNESSALKFASRSIALRSIFELWSHSNSYAVFHQQMRHYLQENAFSVGKYFDKQASFKITVETYNKHFSQAEKVAKIETFDYLPLQAEVNLKNPFVEWGYIEFWGLDPNQVPEQPDELLFGRLVCDYIG